VTFTVTSPDAAQAYDALFATLGSESCVVGAELLIMDARLAQGWGYAARCHPRMQVCSFPDPASDELWSYAQALGALLDAQLDCMETADKMHALTKAVGRADSDLIIFGRASHPLIRRLLSPSMADGVPSSQHSAPSAILVAQRPRWPLERILLVLCGDPTDGVAVDWALRLACPSTAAVTTLAVVPPVPAMYYGLSRMEQTWRSLLTSDTALGCQMRQASQRLAACMVDCTLHLRQGAPDHEICQEIIEGDYDLIVMATKPCRWWLRQLTGDPVCSLLGWVSRPVLFVKPTTA
jgi:nucleotide-binding universal stress UspA family protein